MTYAVPIKLETERLVLRMFEFPDWRDLHALFSDPQCTEFTLRRTLNEDETWRTMATCLGHWQLRGYGPYAIVNRETDRVIGITGLWYPEVWPEPEIMWSLARAWWGKGYAREAATAVKNMAAETIPATSLISLIDKDNERSKKVALSLGAKLEKEIIFKDSPTHIYRHQY